MKYGCFNTPRKDAYFVRSQWPGSVEWGDDPEDRFLLIADNSTKSCQYRKTTPDPKCEGCTK